MNENEASFDLNELFFSKTDLKGLIQSGNSVFIRVSGFSEQELLHKPHNIVRHDDMPRTVFKLLWAFLKAGKPIAAYVKNKSKTGQFYWVFAMAFPMNDGYLSVRLKPTTALQKTVEELYKEVLLLESTGVSLDESVDFLSQKIKDLGFSSYDEFMRKALLEELASRDALLASQTASSTKASLKTFAAGPLDDFRQVSKIYTEAARLSFAKTRLLSEKMKSLIDDTQAISKTCLEVKYVTVNLTISSAKLGDAGKPLSVVSNNLEKLTGEISQSSNQFEEYFKEYEKALFEMYFAIATSRFQIEMMHQLCEENTNDPEKEELLLTNCSLLRNLISENFNKVTSTSAVLVTVSKALLNSIETLAKVTNGMGVIHVIGKIEMARTGSSSESLSSRLKEMEELTEVFKTTLQSLKQDCSWGLCCCEEIEKHNQVITDDLNVTDKLMAV